MAPIPLRWPSDSPSRAPGGSTWWISTVRSVTATTRRRFGASSRAWASRSGSRWGAGCARSAAIRRGLDLGATRVVIGTAAALDPDFLASAAAAVGAARLAAGVDARDGLVAVRGWTETSSLRAGDLAARALAAGIATVIYTDVARDGMLEGPDIAGAVALQPAGGPGHRERRNLIARRRTNGRRGRPRGGHRGTRAVRRTARSRRGPRDRDCADARLMLAAGLVIALAAGLAAFTYLRLEGLGRRAWLPLGAAPSRGRRSASCSSTSAVRSPPRP